MSVYPHLPARMLPEVTAILDGYAFPAVLLGLDYHILAANRVYREVYGDGQPVRDRRCYAVSHHHTVPCDQAGEMCPLRAALESGEPQRVLHVHHTPRGEEHVDVETRPVRDEQGRVIYFVETLRPVKIARAHPAEHGLVGRTPPFRRVLELVQRVAPSETAVLLLGESGTGKEAVAEAIHAASHRAQSAFVAVECSGLTESLFESELFGHEKGSFTGAHNRKNGLVQAAQGGTLFLDEIGDIPLAQQVKLLRLLETGTYRRVGSVDPQQAAFRLICATHRDLKDRVAQGQFRQDLYYRISAFPIQLPPLRERKGDLALLSASLLKRMDPKRKMVVDLSSLACLEKYAFPGNIRELRNILERARLLADAELILPKHLPEECRGTPTEVSAVPTTPEEIVPLGVIEQRYLKQLLNRYPDNRRMLAQKLGISERTLYRKVKELK
jgi:two-component system response regulator HydG